MEVQYDPAKSQSNASKHGLDFDEARAIWADENRVETAARTIDETRWRVTGQIRDALYTAIVTYRDGSTRIISVRRAHEDEVRLYEQDN